MDIVEPPRVVYRPEMPYLGVRLVTPFRGMLSVRDRVLAELHNYVVEKHLAVAGPYFLRLHVIDMNGPMDIEVGVVTPDPLGDNDRVRACRLPAGDYATLTDREHDIRANRALLEWVRSNGIRVDRSEDPSGIALRAATRRFLPIPGRSAGRKSGPFKSICEFAKHVRLIPSHDQPLFAPSITVFLKDGRSFTRHATGREFIWDFEEEVRRIYGVVDGIPISAHQFMAPTEMPGGRKIEHSRQSPAGQRPATRLKQRSSPRKAASTTPSSVWPSWHNTIVGTANLEHLAANLAAARKGPLPPDVYAEARRRLAQPAAM